MDEKITYWASVAFGAIALLLLVLTVSLVNSNRHLQEEISMSQMEINRDASLSQTNQALIQALAEIVVKDNDSAVKDLLGAQGITLKPNPNAAAAATKAPDDKKKK